MTIGKYECGGVSQPKYEEKVSGGLRCCQVITGIVLFLFMVICLVANKVSLICLLGGRVFENKPAEAWYAALGLVLIVPEVIALIKVFWNTSFIKRTKTHQWPSCLALFVGFLASFAEASCYIVFTLEVAPRLPVHILLPILSAVFAVALSHDQLEHLKNDFLHQHGSEMAYDVNFTLAQKKQESSTDSHHCHDEGGSQNWKRVLKTIFGFSGLWSTCAIAGIVALTAPLPWFHAICLPACVCILSLCWHPRVQVYIVRSSDGTFLGRWKATCVYTIMKLTVLVVGLSIVMLIRLQENYILDRAFFYKLHNGLKLCSEWEIVIPLVSHLLSGFFVHVLGYLSAHLTLTNVGITLPSLLATPISVGLVMWMCVSGIDFLGPVTCFTSGVGIWCACGLAVITWIAPYLIRGKYLNRSCDIVMKPFDELFIQPTWNSVFLDQHLSLNYKFDGFSSTDHIFTEDETPVTRVFICTTMYREADFEMSRLLKSLNKVAASKRLASVYKEAHIFLDNGTQDLHFTDFAGQLVSLLQSKIGVSAKDAQAYVTPYGVQLNWTLQDGMPFFLHLKDSTKVKPKKRWSQVMYMSYVLNFRVLRDHSREKISKLLTEQTNIDDSIFVGYASDKEWSKNTVKLKSTEEINHLRACAASTPPNLGCQTPYYLRENRKHLTQIFHGNYDPAIITTNEQLQEAYETIAATESSDDQLTIHIASPGTSSDQGIGFSTSDDQYDPLSDSSATTMRLEEGESSESRNSSFKEGKHDERWRDYEGDVSSNNENSLTSVKAKQFLESAKGSLGNRTLNYENASMMNRGRRTLSINYRGNRAHCRPKRPPMPSPKNKVVAKDSSDSGTGNDNPGFDEPDYDYATLQLPENRPMPHASDKPQPNVFVISTESSSIPDKFDIPLDDHTYILATDADMEFDDDSVADLLNLCHYDRRLGGACGRTHPIGQRTGPLVWYQKFEYAKDFWMIKSAQNVIGSVMCCPGCFSLYRAGAVRDVLGYYAGPTSQPFDVFIKDTGEDRWMCTLMMLKGWKLEYTAFCNNTTYCPSLFDEFMKQRRRWVLSDIANMLLVFKNIFKLAQKNDSFSIAYILYMIQMFIIVMLSPASTIIILAGGLNIAFGVPFEVVAPSLGVLALSYALVCLIANHSVQVRCTLVLTLFMGLGMIMAVVGGSIFVFKDMVLELAKGNFTFQEYYLIILLISALIYAALIHPKETWLLMHGAAYLLGFPAIQILLPIYAVCNIVDQSWGTRDGNKSKKTKISCFSRNRKKYHNNLSTKCDTTDGDTSNGGERGEKDSVTCPQSQFKDLAEGHQYEESVFWQRMRDLILAHDVNLGLSGAKLASGLRTLRIVCLLALIILNVLWMVLLSVLYFNADVNLARMNVYGLIAGAVYGLVLFVQLVGMTIHRLQAIFNKFALYVFGKDKPVWIYTRTNT